MNTSYDKGYREGVFLACAARGIAPTDFVRMQTKQAAVEDSPVMQSAILKIASSIFHAAGEGFEGDAAMYDALLDGTSKIRSEFAKRAVLDPVVLALSEQSTQEQFEKMAKLPGLTSILGKTLAFLPDTIQGLSALSLLVGGGLGAGWWALNRDARTSSAETTAKEEQAAYYRELAKKIRRKTGKIKSKALLQKAIENYVAADDPAAQANSDINEEIKKERAVEEPDTSYESLYA